MLAPSVICIPSSKPRKSGSATTSRLPRRATRSACNVRVQEGEKERLQAFEGVCIARRGSGVSATFTVRKISNGVGVERIFPLHSPMIADIIVVRRGRVRRAKLYYLRHLTGKATRIKETKVAVAARRSAQAPTGADAAAVARGARWSAHRARAARLRAARSSPESTKSDGARSRAPSSHAPSSCRPTRAPSAASTTRSALDAPPNASGWRGCIRERALAVGARRGVGARDRPHQHLPRDRARDAARHRAGSRVAPDHVVIDGQSRSARSACRAHRGRARRRALLRDRVRVDRRQGHARPADARPRRAAPALPVGDERRLRHAGPSRGLGVARDHPASSTLLLPGPSALARPRRRSADAGRSRRHPPLSRAPHAIEPALRLPRRTLSTVRSRWSPAAAAASAAASPTLASSARTSCSRAGSSSVSRRPRPRSGGGRRRASAVSVDVREPERVQRWWPRRPREHGRIDLLVNNAAGNFYAPSETLSANAWRA